MNDEIVVEDKSSVSPFRNNIAKHSLVEPGKVFAVLATIQATLIFTIVMIGVPLPAIGAEFGLNQAQLVLISAGYGLPFSGLLLFGGRLTDRFSGMKMFTFGAILFSLASVCGIFAPGYGALLTVRLIQGVGAALTAPALMALLREIYPEPADFGRAMATWGGVSVLGGAVGFLLSGIITSWVSWRFMFIFPVVSVSLGFLIVRRLMGNRHPETTPTGLDPLGAILATCGIASFSAGLIFSGEYAWGDALVWGMVLAGIILFCAFLLLERKVAAPLLPPRFIIDSTRAVGLVGILLAAAGMGLITFLLSLYLQQMRGWSPLATSMAFIPYTVGLLVINRAAGALIARFHALTILIAGLLVGALGLFMLAPLNADTAYSSGLLPGLFILPAGASLVFSGSAVLSTSRVPQHQAGLAGGVMNTAMELGPTMGLASLMAVAATQANLIDGYGLAFSTAGVVYVIAAIVALLCAKSIRSPV